jgi:succinate dehydrogenase flavin-adding protein (antitoxin of CptAB toxin-antitoxin module)
MKELDEYYESRKPFFEAKIQRVQETNKKKFDELMRSRSEKLAKTLKKIETMQSQDLDARHRYNEEL